MDEKSTDIVATPDLGAFLNFVFAPLFIPIYFINQMLSQLPAPQMPMPQLIAPQQSVAPPQSPGKAILTNTESWEWIDYAGRERKIVVHRAVK